MTLARSSALAAATSAARSCLALPGCRRVCSPSMAAAPISLALPDAWSMRCSLAAMAASRSCALAISRALALACSWFFHCRAVRWSLSLDTPRSMPRTSATRVCILLMALAFSLMLLPVLSSVQSKTRCACRFGFQYDRTPSMVRASKSCGLSPSSSSPQCPSSRCMAIWNVLMPNWACSASASRCRSSIVWRSDSRTKPSRMGVALACIRCPVMAVYRSLMVASLSAWVSLCQ